MPCCFEVAVSVLTALGWRKNDAPEDTRGAARAERREEAGRASLETERRNTIVEFERQERLEAGYCQGICV